MEPKFGATFSLKYAREMGIDPKACLEAAVSDLGVRRLRLMSYWDIHEPEKGSYTFQELDWQVDMAEQYGAQVSLAVGLRQPRWPESHWPEWAKTLPDTEWQAALTDYISAVVNRYKDRECIVSWQLENVAMLKKFGQNGNFDRNRLKTEFNLVRNLDPIRPIIMSTSDSWGIPFFGPKPDIYGFSIYRHFFDRGAYRNSNRPALFYKIRAGIMRIVKNRPVFIHELQCEPWGPVATSQMTLEEQYESINPERVKSAVKYAQSIRLYPVDLWGLEWWYWLKTMQQNEETWEFLKSGIFSKEK